MSLVRPFVLDVTGRVSVNTGTPSGQALNGQVYQSTALEAGLALFGPTSDTLKAAFVTTTTDASDTYIGGFRYSSTGALVIVDATAGDPSPIIINQGIAMNDSGQVAVSYGPNTTYTNQAGLAVSATGVVYANDVTNLDFALEFADLGNGQVDTTESITGDTPTFTRATTAWTKLQSGLWAQVASGVPRSFYAGFSTATGAYLGYLAEGARTNSALHSRKIAAGVTATEWTESNVTAADNATGIDGVASACSTLTASAADGTILQARTIASAAKTFSAFVRRKTGSGAVYITLDNDSTRTEITNSINSSTYTRVSATQTLANPTFGFKFAVSGDAIEVDMVMLEDSASFASSPIPTTTASVTRNADVLTYDTTGWLNASAGTLYIAGTTQVASVVKRLLEVSDGTDNERYIVQDNGSNQGQFVVTDGGVGQVGLATGTLAAGVDYLIATAYAANDFALVVNGGSAATDTSGTLPTVTTAYVGVANSGSVNAFGPIRRVAYFGARLSDDALQALTSG